MKQKKKLWLNSILFISILFAFFSIFLIKKNELSLINFSTNLTQNNSFLQINNNLENFNKFNLCNNKINDNNDFSIKLVYNNEIFNLNPTQSQTNNHTIKDFKYTSTRRLNYKNIIRIITKIRKMGFSDQIAFNYIFAPLKFEIEQIKNVINTTPIDATIYFDKTCNSFVSTNAINGFEVDEQLLYTDILDALLKSNKVEVKIKTKAIEPKLTREEVLKATKKQSSFSTYYGHSSIDRKSNIKLACKALHGYEIKPGQIFSFNEAIGKRCPENGYKEANIIKDGQFVKGVGGGVCQVSTTLYNALLLANIRPIEVHKHSLPVSYVKPGLDAMVSWSTADLKFKNTTNLPIFITSHFNDSNLTFCIYGNTKDNNTKIKTVSQIIKTIPHKGDKILPDVEGKYADKIMFKGEFIREKAPKDGYIAHAYIDTYKNDILVSHELIREVMYEPQLGIVYEGTEDLPEGMTLPNTN